MTDSPHRDFPAAPPLNEPPRTVDSENLQRSAERIRYPDHYNLSPEFQTWDVIEAVVSSNALTPAENYHVGEVLRYLTRLGRKKGRESALKDAQKARACIDRLILLLGGIDAEFGP